MRKYFLLLVIFVSLFGRAAAQSESAELAAPVDYEYLDSVLDGEPIGHENDAWPEEKENTEAAEEYESDLDETDYEDEAPPMWDLREVDKTAWEKIKKDKRFIYKKEKPKKEKKQKKKRNFDFSGLLNSGIFKIILYILFGGFLVYVIYLFIKNNDISFRKNVKDKSAVVEEKPWEDLQRFEDWELALQSAIREKDYRLATRIYYLHTLNLLNKSNLISYREDKTNWYYVQKLFGTSYHDEFKHLTTIFDYVWYGEYEVGEEQFSQLQTEFKTFHYKIR